MALKTERKIVGKQNDLVWIFKGDLLSLMLLTRKLTVSNAI